MPDKIIYGVGFAFPGGYGEFVQIESSKSLLDADIVLFEPRNPFFNIEKYQGKMCLDDTNSFHFHECREHWRRALKSAFDAGKTAIIFLTELQEFFAATGQVDHSGTGRNRSTTRYVSPHNNFELIPYSLGTIVRSEGKSMRLTGENNLLASYWKDFSAFSEYAILIDNPNQTLQPLITTRTGDKCLGGILRGKGTMLFLPPITYDYKAFVAENKDGEEIWTKAAVEFGTKLLRAILELDATCKEGKTKTPPPMWARESRFRLKGEAEREAAISHLTSQISHFEQNRSQEREKLDELGSLRDLLFEKGPILERAIRNALEILGFKADHFKTGESEFDAVFEAEEGRFLGEVEGRDKKAIAIDKFSQLERNLQEDFQREEVTEYAKGVLFGNAHRLEIPDNREEHFTEKVISAAKRSGIALVRTINLFTVTRYVHDSNDMDFAKRCREAIRDTIGNIVAFPPVPEDSTTTRVQEDLTDPPNSSTSL